ncbi:hypothetical protein LRS05_06205 [Flavobacterium sp. J372]|uniref:hypothetical protein n=1 Tax=Flavobacterium sp. J372 TaxID=2898436 RepID=UPI00215190AD|nr:hypothetical protein [Flavobacterium sp. J372]MCR5861753.1 hypothetical protein [Flavobacterium sp. J372]
MSNDRNNDSYGHSHGSQHDQRANKGNSSWNDEGQSMQGNNPGENWESGQQQEQGMGSRGNSMNNASMSGDENYSSEERSMSGSDNDDFNNQGWPEDEDMNAQSRTFNEDEETYDEERNMSGGGSGGYGGSNRGTENNNWDATDQTQRFNGVHDDEQFNASSHGQYSDEEQNRYGQENDRRNREELE